MDGCVTGGVNIGAASAERLGKMTPERCQSYLSLLLDDNFIQIIKHRPVELNAMKANQER